MAGVRGDGGDRKGSMEEKGGRRWHRGVEHGRMEEDECVSCEGSPSTYRGTENETEEDRLSRAGTVGSHAVKRKKPGKTTSSTDGWGLQRGSNGQWDP